MAPPPSRELEQHFMPATTTPGAGTELPPEIVQQPVQHTVPQAVQQPVQQPVQQDPQLPKIQLDLSPLQRATREPTRPATFRLPDRLHAELLKKAHYNGFSQTGIVIEALKLYLANLPG
jgi:hypothetical protein